MDLNLLGTVKKIVARHAQICTCKVKPETVLRKIGIEGEKLNSLRSEFEQIYNLQPSLYQWETVLDIYNFLEERIKND